MDLPTSFYIVGALLVFLIGVSKAGIAGGATSLSVPILSLFVSPLIATGILLPLMIVVDVAALFVYRKHVQWSYLLFLIPGSIIGVCLGTLMVGSIDPEFVKLIVGVIALWFSLLYFSKNYVPPMFGTLPKWAGIFFAAISGFTSHLAHAGAPPVRGFLLGQNLPKTPFLATFVTLFFIINIVKVPPYVAMGQINTETLWLSLSLAPLLPFGIYCGLKLHHWINQQTFMLVSYSLLLLAGIKLTVNGIQTLY